MQYVLQRSTVLPFSTLFSPEVSRLHPILDEENIICLVPDLLCKFIFSVVAVLKGEKNSDC